MTYEGWENYETWNIMLWINNEEALQNYWQERAAEIYKETTADEHFTKEENAKYILAEELKTIFENEAPELDGTYADLLMHALENVNWHEIAEALLEDIAGDR